MRMADGLVNLTSGMGTARDKAAQSVWALEAYNPQALMIAYKSSSLIRRAIEMPAEDSCREWREWQAEAVDISAIEAEEKRLDVRGKVLAARILARLFGGGAILIGTGESDPSKPLNPASMKAGGIKYLTVISRDQLTARELELNPLSPLYGTPKMWSVMGEVTANIHPSRVVVFHGIAPMTGNLLDAVDGWGTSNLNGMMQPLTRVDEVMNNILSLVYEAKVDVVKIPDLMLNLQQRGTAYSDEVIRRLMLAATGKGINGTLILDALEEYEQKSASFGSLADILDRAMQLASAACGIPMTLFFGMSAGGLNASGDIDIRGYYDRVKVEQTLRMQPAMAVLDECLIWSALGQRPEELHYSWRSLWQPTAKERAEVGKMLADAMKVVWDTDTVPSEAIGAALVNALTESGAFPGFEGYVHEFTEPTGTDGEEDTANDPALVGRKAVADAEPRTLYVRRDVLNGQEIVAWAKSQGFKTTLPATDMHVTISYSRSPVDWMKMGESWQDNLEVPAGGARLMQQFGEARVLLFNSSNLSWRHGEMKSNGATWDHPEYQPNITISYDPESPDLAAVTPFQGKIMLGPEIFQEVKEGWQAEVKEG